MIPEFDPHGLLPPGVHSCTMSEIGERFCWTSRRQILFDGLQKFITTVLPDIGFVGPILVDGSFARKKEEPGDIDVILDTTGMEETSFILLAYKVFENRPLWKDGFLVEAMVYSPNLPLNIVDFFQYIGEKAAAELNLDLKHPKGILRLP